MFKGYAKLKTAIQAFRQYRHKKRLNQSSFKALSQLNDHLLTDIGLIDEDLHLLYRGETPQRFFSTKVDKIKLSKAQLISHIDFPNNKAEDPLFRPEYIDKAA